MLIDSNIFVEIARGQEGSQVCEDLLSAIEQGVIAEDVYVSRFTLHAVEAMISTADKEFVRKILLMINQGKISVIDLSTEDEIVCISIMEDLSLDFDDTVQYFSASKVSTYIVTFDRDFCNTGIGVKTPEQVLEGIFV